MSVYSVEYTPAARNDLKSIYSYIAFQLKERSTARNVVNRIRKQIRDLDTSPEKYASVEWEPWASMGMRKFSVGNYVVFYIVNNDKALVTVNRIFYGGRSIQSMIQSGDN